MRDSSHSTPPQVVDVIDDGMTDEEFGTHTQAWLAELGELSIIDVDVRVVDVIDEL